MTNGDKHRNLFRLRKLSGTLVHPSRCTLGSALLLCRDLSHRSCDFNHAMRRENMVILKIRVVAGFAAKRFEMASVIRLKRAYESPSKDDGKRYLVERLWPRGIKKEELPLEGWLKEVAPSTELRTWFSHDPGKWAEFRKRYFHELDKHAESWKLLLDAQKKGVVTLIYSSKDEEHNNAVALRDYLKEKLAHK
jgi:uncharacterized protein YeaO (DUF488 family)